MSTNLDLALRIRSQLGDALNDLKKLESELGDVGTKAKKAGSDFDRLAAATKKLVIGGGLVIGLRAIANATIEAEANLAQLDARLKSTGGVAGLNREQLLSMAGALQSVTTFEDDAVVGAEAVLAQFTNLHADVFPQALAAVLDMSIAMKQDLASSAQQVGKALQSPVRGAQLLGRSLGQLSDAQNASIKAFVDAGDVASAQRVLLAQLETQMGGAARAARDTLGGALVSLRNAFGDLLEGDSGPGGLKDSIESLIKILQDPTTKEGMAAFVSGLSQIASFSVAGTAALAGLTGRAVAAFQAPKVGDFLRLNDEISETEKRLARLQARAKEAPFDQIVTRGIADAKAKLASLNALLQASLADSAKAAGGGKPAPGAGGIPPPPPEINEEYEKLLASLKDQAAHMGLVGEAAKVRYAIEHDELGKLAPEQQALLLKYAQSIDAQAAAAEAAKQAGEAAKKAQADQASYVAGLERKAELEGKNTEQVLAYEIAEHRLTGALLQRAQAAAQVLATAERQRQADEDAATLAGLRIEQLRAEGDAEGALALEIEQKYAALIARLKASGNIAGIQIIDGLINTERARQRLDEIQQQADRILGAQSRNEQSVQAEQQAGLLSEVSARERILDIHRQTQAQLEQLRPTLTELAAMPGAVGESATRLLQTLDEQMQRLKSTTSLLQETLRGGLETGISSALQGLARGTLDLRAAIDELVLSVSDALLEMAAKSLAQGAAASIMGLFGGGAAAGAEGAALTAGAAAVTSSATALGIAGGSLIPGAAAIEAAALSLAAAATAAAAINGGSGGGSGGSGGLASLLSSGASLFAATGGHVTGPGTGTSDSIRAAISHNEFITRAAVVTQPGALPFLHDFNRRGMASLADWTARIHHATGGLAGVPAPAFPAPASASMRLSPVAGGGNDVKVNQKFLLVDDPTRIADAMRGPAGEAVYLMHLSRNPEKVRQILKL